MILQKKVGAVSVGIDTRVRVNMARHGVFTKNKIILIFKFPKTEEFDIEF